MRGKHVARSTRKRAIAAAERAKREAEDQQKLLAQHAELLEQQREKARLLEEAGSLMKTLNDRTHGETSVVIKETQVAMDELKELVEVTDELNEFIHQALFSSVLHRHPDGIITLDNTIPGRVATADGLDALNDYRFSGRKLKRHEHIHREIARKTKPLPFSEKETIANDLRRRLGIDELHRCLGI